MGSQKEVEKRTCQEAAVSKINHYCPHPHTFTIATMKCLLTQTFLSVEYSLGKLQE